MNEKIKQLRQLIKDEDYMAKGIKHIASLCVEKMIDSWNINYYLSKKEYFEGEKNYEIL